MLQQDVALIKDYKAYELKNNNNDVHGCIIYSKYCNFLKGNLYGRGASDNKAPVLAWIHTVEVYKALGIVRQLEMK